MKAVSVKLMEPLLQKLERAARKHRVSKSELIWLALEQYLDGERTIAPGSALEAAWPWVGCVAGPGDLATDPKYLEGFGE